MPFFVKKMKSPLGVRNSSEISSFKDLTRFALKVSSFMRSPKTYLRDLDENFMESWLKSLFLTSATLIMYCEISKRRVNLSFNPSSL